jgi:hypothetical protein
MDGLSQQHYDDLKRSGLNDETIEAACIASIAPSCLSKAVSPNPYLQSAYGILYPGCKGFCRFRCSYREGHEGSKYLQAKDSGNHLYIPRTLDSAVLQDPTVDLIITEGEKKALKACQERLPCIAVSGLWNWSKGGKQLLDDFDKIALQGRTVFIVPDNDFRSRNKHGYKKNLIQAVNELGLRLIERGAKVYIILLPEGDSKVGLDDYLLEHGVDEFRELPTVEILPLDERVSQVTSLDEVAEALKEIARIRDTVSQTFLINRLAESPFCTEHRIGRQALKRDLKRYTQAFQAHHRDGGEGDGEVIEATTMKGLVDIVLDPEGKALLLFKYNNELRAVDKVEGDGALIVPPAKKHCRYLMGEAEAIISCYSSDTNDKLYCDVYDRLTQVSVLPGENYYHLVTTYIHLTYLGEQLRYFPYVHFYGQPERGKSRIHGAATILSWRGFVTETVNEAFLFRFADRFCGTIGFDLYELSERAQKKGSYDLFLNRFERGSTVARVTNPDRPGLSDTQYFACWGPTFLATNVEIPANDPLRSRCLKITMPEARGIYPNNTGREQLQDLKNRLLAFRARHFDKELPVIDKPTVGRLGDIMHPLIAVAQVLPSEASDGLIGLIQELEAERKDAEADTLAGKIVSALAELEGEVHECRIPFERVRDKVNEGVDERYHRSPQKIGRELSSLGIKRVKSNRIAYVVWEPKTMKEIFKRYGVSGNGTNGTNGTNDGKTRTYASTESTDSTDSKKTVLDLTIENRRESTESTESTDFSQDEKNKYSSESDGDFEEFTV